MPPREAGSAHRHQPPRDVARVLDHEHEVTGRGGPRAGRQLPPPGRAGRQLARPAGPRRATARAPRRRPARGSSATRSTRRSGPQPQRLPVAGRARPHVADVAARGPHGGASSPGTMSAGGVCRALDDRRPRGHAAVAASAADRSAPRRRRATSWCAPRAHVEEGLLGRVGALDRRHEAERGQSRRLREPLDRGGFASGCGPGQKTIAVRGALAPGRCASRRQRARERREQPGRAAHQGCVYWCVGP